MAIMDFSVVKRLLGGSQSAEDTEELYREAMLLTLARATHADSHTTCAEVDTVLDAYQRHTGETISSADVRVAASSDLFESAPLDKWLAGVARRLDEDHCKSIVKALIEVIRVDGHIRSGEGDFFNMVVAALRVTPIDIVELCA
jgi:uncharacterized tellurite resistance protein B-like protein